METPNPSVPAHKQKAYRIRRQVENGSPVTSEDAEWFAHYEDAIRRKAEERVVNPDGSMGASKNRKVSYTEEESQAVGMGEAAAIAASSALAREEGKRLDNLMDRAITAMEKGNGFMEKACVMFSKMTEHCLAQSKTMMDTHIQILDSLREHHIARTEAESELVAAGLAEPPDETNDIAGDLVKGVLQGLGVNVPVTETDNPPPRPRVKVSVSDAPSEAPPTK
jgi:hypothetical protein